MPVTGTRILFLTDDAALVRRQLEGEDLDFRTGLPLRHDVSTDEITPAAACYHADDTLAEFVYTGLTCGGERPVPVGAVRQGGFGVSVSGRRRGKGSTAS